MSVQEEKSTKTPITTTDSDTTQVVASMKIPPFWDNRPDLWFIQVESQFKIKNITTSNTKYDYLVSSLTAEAMELVADILRKPPPTNKYEFLKEQLLARTRDTEERRLDALLNRIELGDSKPSELYRRMQSLASDSSLVNDSLLKKLWLNKLPTHIRTCLIAIDTEQTVNELFTIADKISDATASSKVSAIKHDATSESSKNDVSESLRRLESRIKRLEISQSRVRHRSQSRNRVTNKSRNSSKSKICWYHKRFGNNATKCLPPCSKHKLKKPVDEAKNE